MKKTVLSWFLLFWVRALMVECTNFKWLWTKQNTDDFSEVLRKPGLKTNVYQTGSWEGRRACTDKQIWRRKQVPLFSSDSTLNQNNFRFVNSMCDFTYHQRYSSNSFVRLLIWFYDKLHCQHKGRTMHPPPFQRSMVGPRVLQITGATRSSSLFESVMEDCIQKSLPYHLLGRWCILNTVVYYLRLTEVFIS